MKKAKEVSNLALLREERTLNINKMPIKQKSSEHLAFILHWMTLRVKYYITYF